MFWRVPGLQRLVRAGSGRGHISPAVWRHLQPLGQWTLHAPDGTPFVYDAAEHDGLARHIIWTDMRDWESTTQPVLFDLARRAEVFVDVGAYSGIYTLLACVANPRLHAVAFEPNPVKLPQLRANVMVNGLQDRVTIVGKALSTESGRATLAIPSDDSTASLGGARPADRTVDVDVTTGDDALGDLPVGLIKIDVEGFEPEVITGMSRVLVTRRPKIIAECLDPGSLRKVRESASAFGYRHAYHLTREGLVPIEERSFHPCNYLFATEPVTATS
ncbi:FkbM family methyltransferase [Actinomadura sp. HBU206391]|uniref:FkbM family methyltransferase n=1 Tax=Actinomadura sp. HBU206391 TaxID=2731692 RepID=UPI0016503031|nr:FkbM family methyltransferase [Actinomadura sp. HBU206391]MBC6456835.1 FkbM family methyltransferase [Actinomadura sp. HBU206391]